MYVYRLPWLIVNSQLSLCLLLATYNSLLSTAPCFATCSSCQPYISADPFQYHYILFIQVGFFLYVCYAARFLFRQPSAIKSTWKAAELADGNCTWYLWKMRHTYTRSHTHTVTYTDKYLEYSERTLLWLITAIRLSFMLFMKIFHILKRTESLHVCVRMRVCVCSLRSQHFYACLSVYVCMCESRLAHV